MGYAVTFGLTAQFIHELPIGVPKIVGRRAMKVVDKGGNRRGLGGFGLSFSAPLPFGVTLTVSFALFPHAVRIFKNAVGVRGRIAL